MVAKAESVPRCEIIDQKYTARHAFGAKPLGMDCVPSEEIYHCWWRHFSFRRCFILL